MMKGKIHVPEAATATLVAKVCYGKGITCTDLFGIEREIRFLATSNPNLAKVVNYAQNAFKRFITIVSRAIVVYSNQEKIIVNKNVVEVMDDTLEEISKNFRLGKIDNTGESWEKRPTLMKSSPPNVLKKSDYTEEELDKKKWLACTLTVVGTNSSHDQIIFFMKKYFSDHPTDICCEGIEQVGPTTIDFKVRYRKAPIEVYLFASNCHPAVSEAFIKPYEDFGKSY